MTAELILKPKFAIVGRRPVVVGVRAINENGEEVVLGGREIIDRYFDLLIRKNEQNPEERYVKISAESEEDKFIFEEYEKEYKRKHNSAF